MNRRLGCMTGTGLSAAAVTLAVVLLAFLLTGGAMFSPGALNAQGDEPLGGVRSHAELGGECGACHPAPWSPRTLSDRCLLCHTEIAGELQTGEGLHGELAGDAGRLACRDCHTEHQGADAPITDIDPATFPHDATGYALSGHRQRADGAAFGCADCHPDSITNFTTATCTECHAQLDSAYMASHATDFGEACLGCHDGIDRYSRARFDHNALSFPLEGAHRDAPCRACHAGATTVADLQGTSGECAACHEEPAYHVGLFEANCEACHTTAGWSPATFNLSHAFPIDHGETGLSTCRTCHPDTLAGWTCYGCHEHEPAEMIEEHADEGISDIANCVRCHPTGQKEEGERD